MHASARASNRTALDIRLACVAIALLGTPVSPTAMADEREVLIGTFRANPAPADERKPDQTAEALLAQGMERLERGQVWAGQRRLEILVARHPRSAEAARARRVLGELYRGAQSEAIAAGGAETVEQPSLTEVTRQGPQSRPADRAPGTDDVAAPQPGAAPQAESSSEPTKVMSWRPQLVRNGRLEDVLRAEAGDRIFFSEGSADIGTRGRVVLAAQARWLNRNPYVFATIEGHADESGSDARNLAISQHRAEAVRDQLVASGVAASRLTIIAKGRTNRIAACDSPLCAAQNRRTVTVIFVEAGSRDDRSSEIERLRQRVPVAAQDTPLPGPRMPR